jgi:type II secretory ATPase GspE/PulE/Tfp pilus assembly ATPase PilB-like protein
MVDSVLLLSVYKPLLLVVALGFWASLVTTLDKDIAQFHLGRNLWNSVHVGVGVVAFVLWLLLPFWLGLVLTVLFVGGALVGYHFYRDPKVPDHARWRLSMDSFRQMVKKHDEEAALKGVSVAVIAKDGKPVTPPGRDDPRLPAHEAMEKMLDFAIPRDAERVEIVVDATQALAVVEIDGVRYPQTKMDPQLGAALIDYIKQQAGMDLADRRKKQTAKLKIKAESGPHTLELTTSGSTRGLNLVIEVDPGSRQSRKYEVLGVLDLQRQALEQALDGQDGGVVLVVSPPDHGLTTTLYTLTSRHDPYTQNIMTLEEHVALELEGVTHGTIRTGPDAPPLAQQLNAILLREPKVMLISQVTEAAIAKVIAEHSKDVRFYAGLRQPDTFTALKAWVGAIGDAGEASANLRAIIAQRLVRRLCTTCRQPYQPDAAALKKMNLPADRVKEMYKHSGKVLVRDVEQPCPACLGLGYRGRTAVFEIMALDDQARALIAQNQMEALRTHLRKHKMLWLQEAGLFKAVEGATSIAEVTRVLAGKPA